MVVAAHAEDAVDGKALGFAANWQGGDSSRGEEVEGHEGLFNKKAVIPKKSSCHARLDRASMDPRVKPEDDNFKLSWQVYVGLAGST
jgi:hypothetical protein